MRKILVMVLMLLCIVSSCFASFEGWHTSQIGQFISFKFPDVLERSGMYEEDMEERLKNWKQGDKDSFHIRLMPNLQKSLGPFASVDIRVLTGRDVKPSFGKSFSISDEGLKKWQDSYMGKMYQRKNSEVVSVSSPEVLMVDNRFCTFFKYSYKVSDIMWNNYVYRFFDRDRIYFVLVAIQSDKESDWINNNFNIHDIVKTIVPLS